MVTYSQFIEIGHTVYKQKGGVYDTKQSAPDVTSTLADFWNQNTDTLEAASRTEARQLVQQNMSV